MRELLLFCTLALAPPASPAPASGAAVGELRRAHEAFDAGDYERAARLFAGLEGKAPRVADYVQYFAAESEFYAGRPARARRLFEALARTPASRFAAGAAWRVADCLWAEGDRAGAGKAYRRLLAPPPRRATKGRGKGKGSAAPEPAPVVARGAGDPALAQFRLAELASGAEARRLFLAVHVEHPAHPLAEEAKRRAAALAPVETSAPPETRGEPTPAERLQRAKTLAEGRNYAAAVTELEALPSNLPAPLGPERDFELGMAKFRMRRDYARAAALLLGVVDALAGERAAMAAFHGTRALSRSDRDDEAIAGYKRVVERFPKSRWAAEAQFLSGWLDFNRGRYRESLPGLEATLARFPKSPFAEDAAWFLAFARVLLKEPAPALDALARYEKMATRGPDAAEATKRTIYFRARTLLALGRRDEAVKLFEESVRRWPFAYYGLGARAQLKALGVDAPLALPPPAKGAPPLRPAALTDATVQKAELLRAAGLDVEAGAELLRAEAPLEKRLGKDPALALFLDRYPKYQNWHRPYQLAEARGAAALASAPTGPGRPFWEAAYPRAYAPLVERLGPPLGAPPLLLFSIMRKESGFSPHDVSYADARGLLQMIPSTSVRIAEELGLPFAADELFVPETNIQLGAAYIGRLHRRFHGQVALTAAAYNAGGRSVDRWCAQNGQRPFDEFVELIAYDQTREYAKRVTAIYARYLYLYGDGAYELPLTVDCAIDKAGPELAPGL